MLDQCESPADAFLKKLGEKAAMQHKPFSATFELTHRCNFHCEMCYVRMNEGIAGLIGEHKTADEWMELARQAKELGVLYLSLTGGECLLFEDFKALYTCVIGLGFYVTVFTNASLIDDRWFELFTSLPPKEIRISLYGASNETYERVTGEPDGYDKVYGNIVRLNGAGLKLKVSMLLSIDNIDDYYIMCERMNALGIETVASTKLDAHRCGAVYSKAVALRLHPLYFYLIDRYRNLDSLKSAVSSLESEYNTALRDMFEPFENCDDNGEEQYPKFASRCNGSCNSFAVLWNGEMRTCLTGALYSVYPFEYGLKAAWDKLQNYHSSIRIYSAKCRNCRYKKYCMSCTALMKRDGYFGYVPDEYICSFAAAEYVINKRKVEII